MTVCPDILLGFVGSTELVCLLSLPCWSVKSGGLVPSSLPYFVKPQALVLHTVNT